MSNLRALVGVLAGTALLALVAAPAQALDGPVVATTAATCRAVARWPKGVTVIGDSLTAQSVSEISRQFRAAGRPVCVNAQGGRQTSQAVSVLRTMRASRMLAPTVVLALGTNDVYTSTVVFNAAAKAALDLTATRSTVWAVGYRATEPMGSARIEGLVGQWQESSPRLTSARWSGVAVSHPEIFRPDRIHPTVDGRKVYAKFLVSALSASAAG